MVSLDLIDFRYSMYVSYPPSTSMLDVGGRSSPDCHPLDLAPDLRQAGRSTFKSNVQVEIVVGTEVERQTKQLRKLNEE